MKVYPFVTTIYAATTTFVEPTPVSVVLSTTTVTSLTTLAPSSITTTVTSTTTLTKTASTTLRASTTTSYATSTLTISTSTTFYAACATPHRLGPFLPSTYPATERGNSITNVVFGVVGDQQAASIPVNTSYDCCVACLTTAGCTFGAWTVSDPSTSLAVGNDMDVCFGFFTDSGVCGLQGEQGGYYVSEPESVEGSGFEIVAYNGCGYLYDGGVSLY